MSSRIDTLTSASSCVYYSSMNPSLEITEDQWAVSIAVEKQFYMHTILLIETVEKSERKNYKAHLMAPGTTNQNPANRAALGDTRSPYCCWGAVPKVDIKKISNQIDRSRYETNYETWSVDRDQVEKMMDEIRKEKDHPEIVNRPFHIFGEQSIFAPTKIDFDIDDERLLEMKEEDPKKFMEMYAYYEDKKAWLNQEYSQTNIPMKYPFAKALMSTTKPFLSSLQESFDEKNLGKASGILLGMILISPILLPVNLVLAVPAYTIDFPRMANEDKEMKENEALLRLFGEHVKKLKLASQNCFNWARCKLATIDIQVGERSSEWFTPIPTSYFSDKSGTFQDVKN